MQVVVERLLERQRAENNGNYPETIAVVLWGTDNIKTYGESLAQVRQADCAMQWYQPQARARSRCPNLAVACAF